MLNDIRTRISKFKIAVKRIRTYLEPVHLRRKILVPIFSIIFYLILLAYAVTYDARRLFGLTY